MLVETFIEKKSIKQMERKLPANYIWFWTPAVREKAKGRPWGGELIGVRNHIKYNNFWEHERHCCNGIEVEINGDIYNLTNVYNRDGVGAIKNIISDRIEANLNKKCIVLGDWNARVGTLGNRQTSGDLLAERSTKDITINTEGEQTIELCEDLGLSIINGNMAGDWNGELTHIDYRSQSVIDYGAANEFAWEEIVEFRIGDEVKSDHFPLEVTLDYSTPNSSITSTKVIQQFAPNTIEGYKRKLAQTQFSAQPEWSELKKAVWDASPKKIIYTDRPPKINWWNQDCLMARRGVKSILRKARRQIVTWNEYTERRRAYKNTIKESKQKATEEHLKRLKEINNIGDAWKYINSKRKSTPAAKPPEDELVRHFKTLLNGKDDNNQHCTNISPDSQNSTEDITEEEFNTWLRKMKKGKATGVDQLKIESFIYADQRIKSMIRQMFKDCINGKPIPEEWRDTIIYPLHKKGPTDAAENYRGIAIGNSIYKTYACLIQQRLEVSVEENQILPDSQNGFRKQRGTIDSIYVLNHCVQSAITNGKHLYTAFIDFKAAFDFVDRKKLFKMMRTLNIPEYLIKAIEEIYRHTPYTIGNTTFYTEMGLKQGCPLSPTLFAIYVSDLDRTLKNWQSGGVVIGCTKIFSLAYADDMALLADRPSEMKEMLGTLYRYTKRKGLIINAEKCKIIKFSPKGVSSTHEWKCGPHKLEEVNSFPYLGFTFQATGRYTKHIENMASNGKKRTSAVWSIGQREFRDNFIIRKQMFHSLVRPTFTYGCEIFGYEDQITLERVQRMYFRWTLGVAPWTRIALLHQETVTEPISLFTGHRAMAYEQRAIGSPCLMLRECLKEVLQGRTNRHTVGRTKYCQAAGYANEQISEGIKRGEDMASMLQRRKREQFDQLQLVAVSKVVSYRAVDRLPYYLQRGHDYQLVARFRLQNEERGRQSWRKDQRCRLCGGAAVETLEHVLQCTRLGGTTAALTNERGNGIHTMKEILCRREKAGRKK